MKSKSRTAARKEQPVSPFEWLDFRGFRYYRIWQEKGVCKCTVSDGNTLMVSADRGTYIDAIQACALATGWQPEESREGQ